jgi:hypothetical protein
MVVIVTALDDCTSGVTIAPQKAPESGVAATLPSTVRRAERASLQPVGHDGHAKEEQSDPAENRSRRRHSRDVLTTFRQ